MTITAGYAAPKHSAIPSPSPNPSNPSSIAAVSKLAQVDTPLAAARTGRMIIVDDIVQALDIDALPQILPRP